jgi:hypothetical protein
MPALSKQTGAYFSYDPAWFLIERSRSTLANTLQDALQRIFDNPLSDSGNRESVGCNNVKEKKKQT